MRTHSACAQAHTCRIAAILSAHVNLDYLETGLTAEFADIARIGGIEIGMHFGVPSTHGLKRRQFAAPCGFAGGLEDAA